MKLRSLSTNVWNHLTSEPLAIFPLLLSGHHRQLDDQVWSLVGQVGSFEKVLLSDDLLKSANADQYLKHATQDTQGGGADIELDFGSLHHIAKNVIHLMEASEAMSKVVVHMSECQLDDETRRGLRYQETLFESVNLRLVSLEKRMQNVIDLVSIYVFCSTLPAAHFTTSQLFLTLA